MILLSCTLYMQPHVDVLETHTYAHTRTVGRSFQEASLSFRNKQQFRSLMMQHNGILERWTMVPECTHTHHTHSNL